MRALIITLTSNLLLISQVSAQGSTEVLGISTKLSKTGASYTLPLTIGAIFLVIAAGYFWYSKKSQKA